jgi:transcriptional regulator with XRE-family HTH domain
MKCAIIKKEILLLEEKMKNLIESGKMSVKDFSHKSGLSLPVTYDWRNGKFKPSADKILDMASRLGV